MDLPEHVSRMNAAEILRWLDSEEACRMLSRSRRRKLRKQLRGQQLRVRAEIRAVRVGLYPFVCSSPWADVVFQLLAREGLLSRSAADNAATACRRGVYPPRTERQGTGMLVCRGCGRPTPRHCVGSSGHCDDCRYGEMATRGIPLIRGSASVVEYRELYKARRGAFYKTDLVGDE